MADEKRLIDANALLAEYDRVHIGEPGKARKLIEDAPEAVVHCRDCKHYSLNGWCWAVNTGMVADDFCSNGERKDNG